jgi:hypothetical protein
MKVVKCSTARRILSAMVDFLVASLMFFVLYAFVMNPIVINTTDYKSTNTKLYAKLSYTGLYDYDSTTGSIAIITPDTTPTKTSEVYAFYESPVSTYYIQNDAISVYEAQKEASGYFTIDGDSYVLNDDVSINNLTNFYISSIKTAVNNYFYTQEDIIALRATIKTYDNIMIYVPLLTSVVILCGIFPICRKKGETIGKVLFNVKVGSYISGQYPKVLQKIVRQLVIILPLSLISLISILMSLSTLIVMFLFIIVGILHLIPIIVSKKNHSFDDIISKTFVYYYDDPKVIDDFDPDDVITVACGSTTELEKNINSTSIDPDNYFDESTLKDNQKY